MAETIVQSTLRLLLLLTVYVLVAVGSRNDEGTLETFPVFPTTPKSTDNTEIVVTGTRKDEPEKPSTLVSNAHPVNEKDSWGEIAEVKAENDEEEDDEGDEYEEELRGIAESHEAMSRDERRNGISSSPSTIELVSGNPSVKDPLGGTNNFDSHEKSTESGSDESSVSNEAMPKDEDEEVAELLKYKQKGTLLKEDVADGLKKPGSKVKRVPTVKKELSTQKEIIASNETQLFEKSIVGNFEIANRLDQETKQDIPFSVPVQARDSNRYEHVRGDISLEEEYTDVDTQGDLLRKPDKRHPTELNGLNSYILGGYAPEQEQQRKLHELGIEEGILAESLMEVLSRLAEDPRRWERVHRILQDVEGDLGLSRASLPDSKKRAYSLDSLVDIPITESSTPSSIKPSTSKKPKKKKKKKKPRHRISSTTSTTIAPTISRRPTPIPFTPPLITTTESPWPTTPAQWRLVAERFGSPWTEDRQEPSSSNLAKVRYAATSKQRGTSGSFSQERPTSIDDKQRESLKTLNNERQALMLQSAREYSQPRRLHYGKVNTHEKGSPVTDNNHDDSQKNYETGSAARVLDYDIAERNYQRPMSLDRYDRYGQYNRQRSGSYALNPLNHHQQQQQDDYDEMLRFPDGITNRRPFARTQPFRPLGREYASTKTWQDSRYDYSRPWKDKNRPSLDVMQAGIGNWPWRSSQQSNYKIWVPRYQPWSRERLYPHRVTDVDDELEDIDDYVDNESPAPRNWQRNNQQQAWRTFNGNSGWPSDGNSGSPTWTLPERPKSYTRDITPISLEKTKNRSDINGKDIAAKTNVKDKPMLPKITMKTWNSLTSDPATWPFKLNGAKPWPKDKNGKSYNPNAELVRKLGLDKQDRLLSSTKDSSKNIVKDSTKYKTEGLTSTSEKVANKEKNIMNWPEKLSAVNEWNNGKSRGTDNLPQRDEARQIWNGNVEGGERKIWSGKTPMTSPKISSVSSWVMPADHQSTWKPYEIKHPAYGQLSEGPKSRWPDGTNNEDTGTIPWSPQKINNNWNSGTSGFSAGKSSPSTSHSSTWPSKWRQFAYHKVTVAPVTKPGSSNPSEGTARSRNSYIAVSAVSAPKYPNNEWRKNDVEDTQLDRNSNSHRGTFDQDDPSSQLRKNDAKELWNQQRGISGDKMANDRQRNDNDPLEHQLEELRHMPYWNHEEIHHQSQKRSNGSGVSTVTTASTSTAFPHTNSTTSGNEKSEKKLEGSPVTDGQVQQKKDVTK